jgi:diguanylate cyclase (GGDEF)-like protein
MHINKMFLSIILVVILAFVSLVCPIRCDASEANGSLSGELDVILNVPSESMRPYVDSFEQKYPNASVSIEYYSDYENDIQNRISTGEYGDVLMIPAYMSYDDFPDYFLPLGELSELTLKYNYLSQSKLHDEEVYGLPSSVFINGIIYNKRIFEEAGIADTPKSTEDFLTDLQLIKDRTSAIPFYTQYNDPWAIQYWEVFPFIEMTGNSDYKFNQFIFEKNPFAEGSTHYSTYSLLYEIIRNGLAGDDPTNTNWNDSKIMLNSGDVASMVMGSWAINEIKGAGPNPEDVAFMPFPNNIDGKQYCTLAGNYCYGISKNSANPELAKAFIDFMLDESGYAVDNDCISILKSDPLPDSYSDLGNVILSSSTIASDAQYKLYRELLKGVDLEQPDQIQEIISAASEDEDRSFDQIMDEWNVRWESARPEGDYVGDANDVQQLWQYSIKLADKQYEVTFSASESEYIQENPKVTVGYVDNNIPFIFTDGGVLKGLAPDILSIISKETGIEFEYVAYPNQSALQEDIINGNIDMMAYAPTSIQGINLSRPYIGNTVLLVYNNNFDRNNIVQNSEAVISGEDYNFLSDMHEQYYADTVNDALDMVFKGSAEYTVVNYYSASFFVAFYSSNVLKTEPLNYYGSVSFGYGANGDSRLISICNKVLYRIPETDIQTLLLQNMGKDNYSLSFKQYLENNPFVAIVLIFIISALVIFAAVIIAILTVREAKRKAKEMLKYEKLSNLIDEYIFDIDYENGNMSFDAKSKEKFNLTGKYNLNNLSNSFLQTLVEQIRECQRNDKIVSDIFEYNNNGTIEYYKMLFSTIMSHGKPIHLIGKIVSAESEYREKEQLKQKSQTDPLTGLYNRFGLKQEVDRIIARNDHAPTAVMIFDLDSFKQVNDTWGHGGGDIALKHLSCAIAKYNDENWISSRIGGDEFVVYSFGISEADLADRLDNIMADINSEIEYDGHVFNISSSCGVVYSDSLLTLQDGMSEADKQLYLRKNAGKNGYTIKNLSNSNNDQ